MQFSHRQLHTGLCRSENILHIIIATQPVDKSSLASHARQTWPAVSHQSVWSLLFGFGCHTRLFRYYLGFGRHIYLYSLIPRAHPQGEKVSGLHQAISGAHRMQHVMWLAWQYIVLTWQRINSYSAVSRDNHMQTTWFESDWCNRIQK